MSEKSWKRAERDIAAWLGGHRVPITGRRGPDIEHRWLGIEVKCRKRLPAWLLDAMIQAVAGSGPAQLPIVVLHQAGSRHADDLVVMRLSDFRDHFGGCGIAPNDAEEE